MARPAHSSPSVSGSTASIGEASLPIPSEPFRTVLDIIAKHFDTYDSDGRLFESSIQDLKVYSVNLGIVRAGISWLCGKGYLVDSAKNGAGGIYTLSDAGAVTVYNMITSADQPRAAEKGSLPDLTHLIPASDRVVKLTDNQFEDLDVKLAELSEAVRCRNDLFADADQRLCVLSELDHFRSQISSRLLRPASAWAITYASGALGWLARTAGGGVVGNLATDLIKRLWQITGIG